MLPVFRDLNKVGPDVSRLLIALGPFSRAGIPAFRTLGQAAKAGGPALQAAKPTVDVLGAFTARARNVARNLALLLTSFDQTKGVSYLTSTIFNLAMSVNGFDDYGHYLRTTLLAGCNSLATVLNQACSANFIGGGGSPASAASARPRSAVDKLLAGQDPNKVMAEYRRKHPGKPLPTLASAPTAKRQGRAPTVTPAAANKKKQKSGGASGGATGDGMLNYLLGSGQ
jgi:hypothetical protein